MKDICERIDLYIVEGTEKDDYKKLLKVINSVETSDHAEAAHKMIVNWNTLHRQDKSFSGKTRLMKDRVDLHSMLGEIVKKKGINYKTPDW